MRLRRTSPRRVLWNVLKGWLVTVSGIIVALTATSKVRKLTRAHRGDGFPRTPPTEVSVSGTTTITTYTYGADLYDDMLGAIAGAQERILFETFIIKDDAV